MINRNTERINRDSVEDLQVNDLGRWLRNERENGYDDQLIVGSQLLIKLLIINNIYFLIIHYFNR